MEVEPSSSPSSPSSFYDELIHDLGGAAALAAATTPDRPGADVDAARSLLAAAAARGGDTFQLRALTDALARQLLDSSSPTASAQAMPVVGLLVRLDRPEDDGNSTSTSRYLEAISASVLGVVRHQLKHDDDEEEGGGLYISPDLLKVWMWQMATSPSGTVHTNLVEALLGAILLQRRRRPPLRMDVVVTPLLPAALQVLTEIWKAQMLPPAGDAGGGSSGGNSSFAKKTRREASIVSVRCASILVDMVKNDGGGEALRLARQSGTTALLEGMLNDFDDPLQQMAVLDLLVQTLLLKDGDGAGGAGDPTGEEDDGTVQDWLSAPPLMSPVLQLLGEPLLSGTAMHYLSLLSRLKPAELDTLLRHIRTLGVVTQETERLGIVQALSHVASHNNGGGLEEILDDPVLRRAWWDVSRISQPKLQAAVLASVALVLPKIESPTLAVRLYNRIGPDNEDDASHGGGIGTSATTTHWLLQARRVRSPMPELRTATYALLSAALATPATATAVLLLDGTARDRLLELLSRDGYRETTHDSRVAYHDLLERFVETAGPMLSDGAALSKLQKQLQLGPHGREAKGWDLATD